MQGWIHVIEWRANVHPQVTALADDRGTAYTYARLCAEVERSAGGWTSAGVRPGDVVAIVAKNSADFLVHAFALMRAGATPAFINWRLSARELAEVLAPAPWSVMRRRLPAHRSHDREGSCTS
jgi:acyl-CoA synthetase (AMP-forming)/AMP-acid ligase II